MSDRMQVIYTAANTQQAHMLKNLLDDAGIASAVVNDGLQGVAGEVPFGWATLARVMVADGDASESLRIALAFDATVVAAPRPGRGNPPEHSADDDGTTVETAMCPDCGRPRMAICPVCETAGTDFPAADAPPKGPQDETELLLICPTCDEPFEPGYLRRCEWCGHDFGRGIEPSQPVLRPPREPINPRVVVVFALIAASIAGLFVYFALLL
jgi:hypothetical protein